jgi:hypothetical protein
MVETARGGAESAGLRTPASQIEKFSTGPLNVITVFQLYSSANPVEESAAPMSNAQSTVVAAFKNFHLSFRVCPAVDKALHLGRLVGTTVTNAYASKLQPICAFEVDL